MRKLICLLIFPMLVYAQDGKTRNGFLGGIGYGIGQVKVNDIKVMGFTFAPTLAYEIYLNQDMSIVPGFRHGSTRFNYTLGGEEVFVKNQFLEPYVMGRHYFPMAGGASVFLAINMYGRWSRERNFTGAGLDETVKNPGWNFGAGAGGGVRFYMRPGASIEVGLADNYDLVKSYSKQENELNVNQVSLYVGVVVHM